MESTFEARASSSSSSNSEALLPGIYESFPPDLQVARSRMEAGHGAYFFGITGCTRDVHAYLMALSTLHNLALGGGLQGEGGVFRGIGVANVTSKSACKFAE
ncbi:hypothetical protein KM043_017223 [Ampulex compressa]|nr:hypothetical protein KM043_017223 [Ampulex compressa]